MPGTAPTGWQNPKTSYTAEDVLTPEQFERIEGNAYATELGARTIDPSQSPTGVIGTLRQLLDWFANRIRAILGTTNWYDAPPTTLTAAKSHIDAAAPHSGHATTTALTEHTSAAAPHSGHETPSGAQAKVDAHASQSAPHSGHATTTALNNHTSATNAHSATSAATANRIMMRDSAGRAKVAAPAAADDIATLSTVQTYMPTGAVLWFARSTPPIGFLECNGAAVSRTTYAALFAVIGTTFGAGDGSTTFNLPDLRAEFIRGWDHGRGIDANRAFGSAQAGSTIKVDEESGNYNMAFDADGADKVDVITGTTMSGYGSTETSGVSHRKLSGLRPRNVALLPCIKT